MYKIGEIQVKNVDVEYLSSGLLCGLVTLPVASVTGGLMMAFTSYRIAFSDILLSTIPVLIISGLWLKRWLIIKCFQTLSKGVTSLLTLILAIVSVEEITEVMIPFFSVMAKRGLRDSTGLFWSRARFLLFSRGLCTHSLYKGAFRRVN